MKGQTRFSLLGIAEPVRIDSGLISGTEGSSDEVLAFKGIPYAAPPVGNLRWRAPQPVSEWEGVLKADHFGASSMQLPSHRLTSNDPPCSEDCLYLNVWTAAKEAGERRPVMMWIHGGAFLNGTSATPMYHGDELAKKGVVVVTINYRLCVMGSYVHPELTRESGHNASGNYSLLDMISALHWIQRNIAVFGGDANNVTIFGQSAGAGACSFLMASPLAKGLFHRVICESGGGIYIGKKVNSELAEAEQMGVQFALKAGASSLAELRAKPAVELLKIDWNIKHNIDGWVLPANLDPIFAAGQQNDVPLLAGSNSDEGEGTVRRAWMARTLLRMQNKTGKSKTYLYLFSRNPEGVLDPKSEFPTLPKPGPGHEDEIPYVFNHLDAVKRPWQAWDRELADIMSSYWVNFAKAGDPNGKGGPVNWPAYDWKKDILINFGDKISVESDPFKTVIDAADHDFAAPHGGKED